MASAKSNAILRKKLMLRKGFFPNLNEADFWDRKLSTGFVTLPRTIPLFGKVLDHNTSGKPLSKLYFALWCRTFDDYVIDIKGCEDDLALEAGFSHERSKSVLKKRLEEMESLGFVKTTKSKTGIRYVALLNPYKAAMNLNKNKQIPEDLWEQIRLRATEIGSNDFVEAEELAEIPF